MARPAIPEATRRKVIELRTKNLWSGNRIYKELQGTKWQVSKTKVQDIIREAAAEPESEVEPLHQNEGLKVATVAASEVAANLRARTQEILNRVAAKSAERAEALVDRMEKTPDMDAHDLKQMTGAVTGLATLAMKHVAAHESATDGPDNAADAFLDHMFSGADGEAGIP